MSKSMMSKKKLKMYNMIMNGKSKQKERALFLSNKRDKLKRMNKIMGQKSHEE